MNMRMSEMNMRNRRRKEVVDLTKKQQYIEYPEEITPVESIVGNDLSEVLRNKELREKFFEGVSYEKDQTESE